MQSNHRVNRVANLIMNKITRRKLYLTCIINHRHFELGENVSPYATCIEHRTILNDDHT